MSGGAEQGGMASDVLFPHILHGGDYNLEQWPEGVWDEDVRLMQRAHVNVATLPVFGWASLQPDEDTFTFEWLDRALDNLHAGGAGACLATAPASTPAWLDHKYPDVLRVGPDGVRRKHGNRHTLCHTPRTSDASPSVWPGNSPRATKTALPCPLARLQRVRGQRRLLTATATLNGEQSVQALLIDYARRHETSAHIDHLTPGGL